MMNRKLVAFSYVLISFPVSFFGFNKLFSGDYVSAVFMFVGAFGLMGLGRQYLSNYDAGEPFQSSKERLN